MITMFLAMNNSPQTALTAQIDASTAVIPVADAGVLPAAPNEITIGDDNDAEVVQYTGKSGNTLTGCVRAFGGTTAKTWPIDTVVYRGFTAYDHNAFKGNIENHESRIQSLEVSGGQVVYGALWDKVNAQCSRLYNARGITTNITNFCHRGTVNTGRSNPFDSISPWREITLCNIDIEAYRALATGASVRGCVTAWLGDPTFSYTHANGVWRYRPAFWYRVWDEDDGRHFAVSARQADGFTFAEEAIEGRWHGSVVTMTVGGASKTCLVPKAGMPGKNIAMSTLHTYAKNYGGSVEDIYLYSATDVLMIVEFATMNFQNAVGNGVSDLYRQSSDTIQEAAENTSTVKVLKANAAWCIVGAIFDIGTANGGANIGSFIIGEVADDPDDDTLRIVTLTTDGTTAASVTVTTAHMWSVHGLSNVADVDIGKDSGYIGSNGQCHAYYRGQEAHANLWRYVLGAYRETGTGKIWIAHSRAEADLYDALNTTVHKNTGIALPQGAGGAAGSGYINKLGLCDEVGGAPICTEIGGNSTNPVGDYVYWPTLATENTIVVAGGFASRGSYAGRFYGSWGDSASNSYWDYAAVPVLKIP